MIKNEDWAQELETKYKHLFETYIGEGGEGSYYQSGDILRGIECNRAWQKPIASFLESLEWLKHNRLHIDNPNYIEGIASDYKTRTNLPTIKITPEDVKIQIFQIKEKFSECRCYITYSPHIRDDVNNLLGKLEARTALICYNCGIVTDKLELTKRYIIRLCPNCMEKHNERFTKKS